MKRTDAPGADRYLASMQQAAAKMQKMREADPLMDAHLEKEVASTAATGRPSRHPSSTLQPCGPTAQGDGKRRLDERIKETEQSTSVW